MHKLLIVDDDPSLREGLEEGLLGDFEVRCLAGPGAEGAGLEEGWADVVLLDQNLGPTSGTQLLAALPREGGRMPPVVLVSAAMDVGLARRAIRLGASDCLDRKSVV